MSLLQLNAIEDAEASGEVARIYGDIQRALSIPFVPNLEKVLANAPVADPPYFKVPKVLE